jgi:anion-transporting  ArsA/GET3 family ATPase
MAREAKVLTPLAEAIRERDVIVCVGSGGVGKTTVAATLALEAARAGRRSLVCTIDPAKRLARALGLESFRNAETRIDGAALEASGRPLQAPMHAMMLDLKDAWDELIRRYAPPDKRDRILTSRFYRSLSTSLAGSQEYVALEKLWELRSRGAYDLVVLDTPPIAHALDFLDAPNRVLDFLDNEAARWLLTPALAAGKLGLQLFNLGGSYVAKTLSKFTGAETLSELAGFMGAISSMNQNFRERAQAVRSLLSSEQTAFVLVTAPTVERMDETDHFHTVLQQHHMGIAAIVVNRVHPLVPDTARTALARLPAELHERAEQTLQEAATMRRSDEQGMAWLRERTAPTPWVAVPRFERDVHDLPGLAQVGTFLTGD